MEWRNNRMEERCDGRIVGWRNNGMEEYWTGEKIEEQYIYIKQDYF